MNYKTIILPIVASVCLGVATITGHTVDANLQDEIATVGGTLVALGVTLYGIFKNHKKG